METIKTNAQVIIRNLSTLDTKEEKDLYLNEYQKYHNLSNEEMNWLLYYTYNQYLMD